MRKRMTVLLTGASGAMGRQVLSQLLQHADLFHIVAFVPDSRTNRQLMHRLQKEVGNSVLRACYGDFRSSAQVLSCMQNAFGSGQPSDCRPGGLVFHVGALVSPKADYHPREAMDVNVGGTRNLLAATKAVDPTHIAFVNIGSVAEYGDRLPPIHWGGVGDPIKPSVFDYYALSKAAAERAVIESGLPWWASLRQTGMMGPAMCHVMDPIILHQPFDNALEYVSDRDSGILLEHLAVSYATGNLDPAFWKHIYDIGGGASCRSTGLQLYATAFRKLGIGRADAIFDPRLQATRNFHGLWYLDSERLEDLFGFRHDGVDYFYRCLKHEFCPRGSLADRLLSLPGGAGKLVSSVGARAIGMFFRFLADGEHGTRRFVRRKMYPQIDAYWGSLRAWQAIPPCLADTRHFVNWNRIVPIDHGYDESLPPSALDRNEMAHAARFRGGALLTDAMQPGQWDTPLTFRCAFGHEFAATPRCVLEGGFWCPVCDRKSWNYGQRARRDPFFAQVWDPLHDKDELRQYPKIVGSD